MAQAGQTLWLESLSAPLIPPAPQGVPSSPKRAVPCPHLGPGYTPGHCPWTLQGHSHNKQLLPFLPGFHQPLLEGAWGQVPPLPTMAAGSRSRGPGSDCGLLAPSCSLSREVAERRARQCLLSGSCIPRLVPVPLGVQGIPHSLVRLPAGRGQPRVWLRRLVGGQLAGTSALSCGRVSGGSPGSASHPGGLRLHWVPLPGFLLLLLGSSSWVPRPPLPAPPLCLGDPGFSQEEVCDEGASPSVPRGLACEWSLLHFGKEATTSSLFIILKYSLCLFIWGKFL